MIVGQLLADERRSYEVDVCKDVGSLQVDSSWTYNDGLELTNFDVLDGIKQVFLNLASALSCREGSEVGMAIEFLNGTLEELKVKRLPSNKQNNSLEV